MHTLSDRVFLGGTCNNSTWREELTPMLTKEVYNPVVKIWTPSQQTEEISQRSTCKIALYCITPLVTGVYSIAELVESSILSYLERSFGEVAYETQTVVFTYLPTEGTIMFSEHQIKSLEATAKMVAKYGVSTFTDILETAKYINSL